MKKRILIYALAGALAAASLAGCGLKGDETALSVGDSEITADEANFYARYTQAQYETYFAAYLGEDMWNSEAGEGETYEESVRDSVRDSMETMLLLEQHMDDYDVSLSEQEQQVIEDTAKEFDENNALEEKEMISGDIDTVKRVLTLMAINQKMTEAIQADADTEVSDEEAAQKKMDYVLFSYTTTDDEGNSEDLSDDEKKTLKETAEKLAADAQAGGDLAELASGAGVEVQSATFDAESETPDADLVAAADKLEEGGVTDAVETDGGIYVAKLTSLLDREATDTKKQSIISERKTELFEKVRDGWKEDAKIDTHDSVWKKIRFGDMSVTMKIQEDVPYTDNVVTDDQAESGDDTGDAEDADDTAEDGDTAAEDGEAAE